MSEQVASTEGERPPFPPEHHVLRDLAMTSEGIAEGRHVALAPLPDGVRDRAGRPSIGMLALFVDSAATLVVLPAAMPDWTATADLSIHVTGAAVDGPLIVDSRLLRAGSRLIVARASIHDGQGCDTDAVLDGLGADPTFDCPGPVVGDATLSFVRMPASRTAVRSEDLEHVGQRTVLAPDSLPRSPLDERVGIVRSSRSSGSVSIDRTEYVRNSMGAVTGGVHGIVMQAAAEDLVPELVAVGLEVRFLSPARIGPVRAAATLLRNEGGHALATVDVIDEGSGALVSTGTVSLGPMP